MVSRRWIPGGGYDSLQASAFIFLDNLRINFSLVE